MQITKEGIDLIKHYESCKLKAYKDSVNVVTIGWGSTLYKDGRKIKMGDIITQAEANDLLAWEIELKSIGVRGLLAPYKVNDNQFSALVSFAYNLGLGNLGKSTLLKKVRNNSNDPTIAEEFKRWNKAGGKILNGLVKRRAAEAKLYFTI